MELHCVSGRLHSTLSSSIDLMGCPIEGISWLWWQRHNWSSWV